MNNKDKNEVSGLKFERFDKYVLKSIWEIYK